MGLQLHLVILILFAALAHASWNAIAKSSGDRFLTATVNLGTGTLFGIFLIPFAQFPDPDLWPYLIASVAIHALYHILLINAYRFGDLSQVYPLARGTAPLVVTVLAMVIEHEIPNLYGFIAIAMISLGIASMSIKRGIAGTDHWKSVVLALMTGLLIASYTLVDGLGARRSGAVFSYIIWLMVLEGIPLTIWALLRRSNSIMPFIRVEWKRAVIGGLLAKFAYGSVLYALSLGAMASVTAMRETSVLFATLIGVVFLGEKISKQRIVSAIVIVCGVVLLQLAG